MVKGHLPHGTSLATGIVVPANVDNSFAVTQATWRFLDNDRVTSFALVEPLRHLARQQVEGTDYTLAIVDWCKLDYKKHTAKKDTVQLTHKHDVGYELTSHLLVSAQNGNPIDGRVVQVPGEARALRLVMVSGLFVLLQMIDFLTDIDFDIAKILQLKTNLNKCLPNTKKIV